MSLKSELIRRGILLNRIQVLVHNVSHSDLLVALQASTEELTRLNGGGVTPNDKNSLIARPQYSKFQPCSMNILEHLEKLKRDCKILEIPMKRNNGEQCPTPYGISFAQADPCLAESWNDYHLRPIVKKDLLEMTRTPIAIRHIYFPLIATILFAWTKNAMPDTSRVIYLLSGEGNSRNPAHGTYDNSTEGTAKLLKHFIKLIYPEIEVVLIHSKEGIFKYKENVKFVTSHVAPLLSAQRLHLAQQYGVDWKRRFGVTISLSSGAPARLLAVSASLRQFEPEFLHMWQPKSFFHFGELNESDIENHSHDFVEAAPPVAINSFTAPSINPDILKLVDAMKAHKEKFIGMKDGELTEFWLRKTKKPVLCVLMYQKSEEESPTFVCGMNIEVSMPTGTLCSERNAIGTALANDPTLKRQHFKSVAVLSLKLDDNGEELNPLAPCGSCAEWLKKIAEVNPEFKVVTFEDASCSSIFVKYVS